MPPNQKSKTDDPPALFKYCSPEAGLRILQNGKVRFTPPNQFNDPFDQNPAHELGDAELRNMVEDRFKEVYGQARFHNLGAMSFAEFRKANFQAFMDFATKRRQEVEPSLADSFHNSFSEKFGILCVTDNKDS